MKPIVRMGAPSLFERSSEVSDIDSSEIKQLIEDMLITLQRLGGVGIAAPQIGVNKRVIIFGFDKSERYPNEKPIPHTILINPEYTVLNEEKIAGWEGCLSVPGMRGKVSRYKEIQYCGIDPMGRRIESVAEGFHARVIQHEVDHLNGVLFPLLIEDMHNFGFEDLLWERILSENGGKKI